jgi:hypothetical protein
MLHPIFRPTFLCRPDVVKGIFVPFDILFFQPEIPAARFIEKEKPNFLPIQHSLYMNFAFSD